MKLAKKLKPQFAFILAAFLLSPLLPFSAGASKQPTKSVPGILAAPAAPVVNQPHRRKVAPDLAGFVDSAKSHGKGEQVSRVIIQLSGNQSDSDVQNKFGRLGGKLKNRFKSVGLLTAELPLSRIRDLEADDD